MNTDAPISENRVDHSVRKRVVIWMVVLLSLALGLRAATIAARGDFWGRPVCRHYRFT